MTTNLPALQQAPSHDENTVLGLLEAIPDGLFAPNVFLTLLAARAGILADGPEVPLAPRDGGVPSIRGWGTMRVALRCAVEMVRFRQRHW